MKTKHYGLIAFAFMILCTAVVVTDALEHAPVAGRDALRPNRVSPLGPEFRVPNPAAIQQMKRLTTLLPILARPQGDISAVDLGLFGYGPDRKNGGKSRALSQCPGLDHTVSFAFFGGDKAFCVIDNTFYKQGALLPNGARVAAVGPRGVLVQKDGSERWLPVTKNTKAKQARGKDDKK
ncbi:MAG: hypothetical protein JRI36_10655 [Deltaproteobacteria bacterium]|nr:hypothetical protein [Deltaproteobacteria bacterium]